MPPPQSMNRCTEIIHNLLSSYEIDSKFEESSGFLRFMTTVKDHQLSVAALVDDGFMSVRMYFPMRFDRTRRIAAAEFVCRASWPLPAGGFCLDMNTGRLAYSVSTSTPQGAETDGLEEIFETLMASATARMEVALGPLLRLAGGRIGARQAVAELDRERNRQRTERVPRELLNEESLSQN